MRGKFFSRARFAYVIQKNISWIFAYLTYLDGDSVSPFPQWTHNENCAVWLPRKSWSQRHTTYAGYAGAYGKKKKFHQEHQAELELYESAGQCSMKPINTLKNTRKNCRIFASILFRIDFHILFYQISHSIPNTLWG